MKNKILFCWLLCVLSFIGCKTNNMVDPEIQIPTISFEEALEAQYFEYDFIQTDTINYRFKRTADSYAGATWRKIIKDSMQLQLGTNETRFTKTIFCQVPEALLGELDHQSISFEFSMNINNSLLNESGDQFLSNEAFKKHFLSIGDFNSDARQAQVGYNAFCYYDAQNYHTVLDNTITLTDVQEISDRPDAFLITFTFETDWEEFNLKNGVLKFIIEN